MVKGKGRKKMQNIGKKRGKKMEEKRTLK